MDLKGASEMKMKFYRDGKKISRKEAEAWLGKETLARRIEEAKATHEEDPYTLIEWMDGLRIDFEF
jgi:hypothetical protein